MLRMCGKSVVASHVDWLSYARKIRSYLRLLPLLLLSLVVVLFNTTPGVAQMSAPPQNQLQPPGYSQSPSFNPAANSQPMERVASLPQNGQPSLVSSDTAESNEEGQIPMRNLLQIFQDGGLLMYPIGLCSFVLTIFVFERMIFLRTGRVIPRPFVRRLIEQLEQNQIDPDEATELCERNGSPISVIIQAAIRRYGRPAVEVEQAVLDAGERETNQLRRYLRLLNGISNVTPLLGLLGTVLGMIEAFNSIANADALGRPEMLAGGIGQALITTAAGLGVAIPAYLAYMYFLGRIDRLVMEMDQYAQQVVDAISAEAFETTSTRSRSRKRAA